MAVFQGMADLLPDGRSAGFAVNPHGVSPLPQSIDQQRQLGAFARALIAFECDEDSLHAIKSV
jgi:hypothetical protein